MHESLLLLIVNLHSLNWGSAWKSKNKALKGYDVLSKASQPPNWVTLSGLVLPLLWSQASYTQRNQESSTQGLHLGTQFLFLITPPHLINQQIYTTKLPLNLAQREAFDIINCNWSRMSSFVLLLLYRCHETRYSYNPSFSSIRLRALKLRIMHHRGKTTTLIKFEHMFRQPYYEFHLEIPRAPKNSAVLRYDCVEPVILRIDGFIRELSRCAPERKIEEGQSEMNFCTSSENGKERTYWCGKAYGWINIIRTCSALCAQIRCAALSGRHEKLNCVFLVSLLSSVCLLRDSSRIVSCLLCFWSCPQN